MKIQTIRPICGHVYFVDGKNASHLSDLPCTRCAGRGYPVEYRSPDIHPSNTCLHCGQEIYRQHTGAYDGDRVKTIIGYYSGINSPIYSYEISGHPDYHPACWIEHVSGQQARWAEQKARDTASHADFQSAVRLAWRIAASFDPRIASVSGNVDEFSDKLGTGYRFTPKGELPVIDVLDNRAYYPDVARNRQLCREGVIQ